MVQLLWKEFGTSSIGVYVIFFLTSCDSLFYNKKLKKSHVQHGKMEMGHHFIHDLVVMIKMVLSIIVYI